MGDLRKERGLVRESLIIDAVRTPGEREYPGELSGISRTALNVCIRDCNTLLRNVNLAFNQG